MDQSALQRLAGQPADPPEDREVPPEEDLGITVPGGAGLPGRIPMPVMGGLDETPGPPEPRHAMGLPGVTPGAPPKRTPTPRPSPARPELTQSSLSHTVVPFAGVHEDVTEEPVENAPPPPRLTPAVAPPRYSPPTEAQDPPAPPGGVRSVTPRDDPSYQAHRSYDDAPEPLRAAPLPDAGHMTVRTQPTWAPEDMPTSVDADSARRSAIDDSRIPTEEGQKPIPVRSRMEDGGGELGLRAAITRADEPALDLSAAVTRHEEPSLGISAEGDDAFSEDDATEAFFTDEAEPPLLGPGADIDEDEVTWKRRRSPLPMIALVVVVLLIVAGGLSVAAFAVAPELFGRPVAALSSDGPSLTPLPTEAIGDDADGEALAGAADTDGLGDGDSEGARDAEGTGDAESTGDGDDAGDTEGADEASTEAVTTGGTDAPASEGAADTEGTAAATSSASATASGTAEPEPELVAPEPAPAVASTEPEPEPEPAPPPPPAPTARRLVDQGWNTVDADPEKAADLFRAALDKDPTSPDANYGLGWAMLEQDLQTGAKAYLCAGWRNAQGGLKEEILGVAQGNGITCD